MNTTGCEYSTQLTFVQAFFGAGPRVHRSHEMQRIQYLAWCRRALQRAFATAQRETTLWGAA
eukprot:5887767-Prymnesium_polylepis.1